MTTNQIKYWDLQETKRSNRRKEDIEQMKADETKRHNQVGERTDAFKLAEKIGADGVKFATDVVSKGGTIV